MPAAAVIPAPLAYAKVVAVKTLVVECWGAGWGCSESCYSYPPLFWETRTCVLTFPGYCEEIKVFKAGVLA